MNKKKDNYRPTDIQERNISHGPIRCSHPANQDTDFQPYTYEKKSQTICFTYSGTYKRIRSPLCHDGNHEPNDDEAR